MLLTFDFDFLSEVVVLIDGHLERLEAQAEDSPDPDQFGVWDRLDYVSGFGFAACQNFLEAAAQAHAIPKAEAYMVPPLHAASGHPVASLTNGAANFWKHRASDPKTSSLEILGVDPYDPYPLASALNHLVAPDAARFGSLIPILADWSRRLGRSPW